MKGIANLCLRGGSHDVPGMEVETFTNKTVGITEYLIIFGKLHIPKSIFPNPQYSQTNRNSNRHRRSHRPPHRRRLLPHPRRHPAGLRPRTRLVPPGNLPPRQRAPPPPRHRQAVQDGRGLLRSRVRPRMDPAHAWLWLCGYFY